MRNTEEKINYLKNGDNQRKCAYLLNQLMEEAPVPGETFKNEVIDSLLRNKTMPGEAYSELMRILPSENEVSDDKKLQIYLILLKQRSPADVIRKAFRGALKIEESKNQKYMTDTAIRLIAKNRNTDAAMLEEVLLETVSSSRPNNWIDKNISTAKAIVNHPNANAKVRARAASLFRFTPEFGKLASAYAKSKDTALGFLVSLETLSPGSILDHDGAIIENKLRIKDFLTRSALKTLDQLKSGEFDIPLFPEVFNFEKKEIEKECFSNLLLVSDKKDIDKNMNMIVKYFKGNIPTRIAFDKKITEAVDKAKKRDSIEDEGVGVSIPSTLQEEEYAKVTRNGMTNR